MVRLILEAIANRFDWFFHASVDYYSRLSPYPALQLAF